MRKHYCESCENEISGDVVGVRLCNGIELYFCDDDCIDDWVNEIKIYGYIYEDGEMR